METTLDRSSVAAARWSQFVWPKEHGSWSLALEPLFLGLLVAPSRAGFCFGLTVIAGFLSRRSIVSAFREKSSERRAVARRVLAACAIVAAIGLGAVYGLAANERWLSVVGPMAVGGALFLFLDFRRRGRDATAEVVGAGVFACVPAIIVLLRDDAAIDTAAAVAGVMAARSIPTLLSVRAFLRTRKGESARLTLVLAALWIAWIITEWLVRRGLAPQLAIVWIDVLAIRSLLLLLRPDWPIRARQLGIFEAMIGIAFVTTMGLAWN